MYFVQKRGVLAAGLLLATLGYATGCSKAPDDNQIAQSIRTQVQKDSAIGGEISVESSGGSVTLNGHVANDAARALASREAAEVSGVRQVINNLTVVTAEAAPAPEPAKPEPAKPAAALRRPAAPRREVARSEPPPAPPVRPVAPVVAAPEPVAAPAPAPVVTAPAPPPPPPAPTRYTIPAGTVLNVRLIDSLDSSKNRVGDTFRASLDSPVRLDGEVVIPAGTDVEGRIVEASNAGAYSGHSQLTLQLTRLDTPGETYSIRTEDYGRSGSGRGKGTAETMGAGAALGAIIGGIAGGGKGAAIGGMAGAGAGGVARGVNKAEKITFPSETVLAFSLSDPVTIRPIKAPPERRPMDSNLERRPMDSNSGPRTSDTNF